MRLGLLSFHFFPIYLCYSQGTIKDLDLKTGEGRNDNCRRKGEMTHNTSQCQEVFGFSSGSMAAQATITVQVMNMNILFSKHCKWCTLNLICHKPIQYGWYNIRLTDHNCWYSWHCVQTANSVLSSVLNHRIRWKQYLWWSIVFKIQSAWLLQSERRAGGYMISTKKHKNLWL